MYRPKMRLLAQIAVLGSTCGSLLAQTAPPPKPAPSKIEPGLEEAVHWKWSVTPSGTKPWGMPLPEELKPKAPATAGLEGAPASAAAPAGGERPPTYEVKKGDALIKIARKFSMTPAQLKQFNALKDDRIVIGQILKIPTAGELLAMEPPPPPTPPPGSEADKDKDKDESKSKGKKGDKPEAELEQEPATPEQLELETVLLQVFLDRELFASGAIDGKGGAMFLKVSQLYHESHADAATWQTLKTKALAAVKQPYINYALRAEDFHFIKPRKAALVAIPVADSPAPAPAPKKKSSKANSKLPPAPPPPLSYDEMVAADFLGYASAWEFVAERFHCDEAFLRRLNAKLGDSPAVGATFQVPNVIPFEIEKALELPLQPTADPQKPVTAAVVDLSLLKISREGQLIAVLPLASARPGLNGRGSWTILDAIPQPHLSTKREPREAPKTPPAPAGGATPPPSTAPAPAAEQVLPAGPNNPLGIVWINLAKAKSNVPLPYGLHGTSIPGQMKSLEGIGGFRLANWDIARAVRLMPAGTPLQWPEVTNPRAAR